MMTETSTGHIDSIDRSMQRTHEWIDEVVRELDGRVTKRQAYSILRGLLQVLRDRLPVEVAANLSAQLPEYLRGVFYEGWEPSRVPQKFHVGDVLDVLTKDTQVDDAGQAQDAMRAGIRTLVSQTSPGTMEKVGQALPGDLRKFLGLEERI